MSAGVDAGLETRVGTAVCTLGDIEVEGGVLALVAGEAVAVFRTYDDQIFALSGWDPYSQACVLARGIVGTRGDTWFVASPMHKQAFDLRTGVCLDDAATGVATYDVWLAGEQVVVGARRPSPVQPDPVQPEPAQPDPQETR